ncbi:hypothetical protein SFRURICE_001106 [Spodoptera frugiperda]|nr:hypothetical protein SFRURICE_001106 [Spodoptera frugiperda]
MCPNCISTCSPLLANEPPTRRKRNTIASRACTWRATRAIIRELELEIHSPWLLHNRTKQINSGCRVTSYLTTPLRNNKPIIIQNIIILRLLRWSSGRNCDCRGLGFDSRVRQNITGLISVFRNFSVVARSLELCPVYGNRLTP